MSYVTRILTQLPFGNIIGAPMKAAIEAQALAAKSTLDFIQAVGFETAQQDPFFPVGTGTNQPASFGAVRNITFTYQTTDGDTNQPRTVSLTVPILTIIPIPYLRIDEMSIDFMAKITEEIRQSNTTTNETNLSSTANASWKTWWSPVSANFSVSLSSKHSSTSANSSRFQTESTMSVHVRAVQDSMPAGLGRVLSLLEQAIREQAQ